MYHNIIKIIVKDVKNVMYKQGRFVVMPCIRGQPYPLSSLLKQQNSKFYTYNYGQKGNFLNPQVPVTTPQVRYIHVNFGHISRVC